MTQHRGTAASSIKSAIEWTGIVLVILILAACAVSTCGEPDLIDAWADSLRCKGSSR